MGRRTIEDTQRLIWQQEDKLTQMREKLKGYEDYYDPTTGIWACRRRFWWHLNLDLKISAKERYIVRLLEELERKKYTASFEKRFRYEP